MTHVWDEPWIAAYGQQDPGIAEDVARIERERDDRLAALVQAAQAHHPEVHPFHQLAVGSAAGLLVEDSRRADLIVTGARRHGEGRHGMQLGPVTQALLHHAECPVAVVPLGDAPENAGSASHQRDTRCWRQLSPDHDDQ